MTTEKNYSLVAGLAVEFLTEAAKVRKLPTTLAGAAGLTAAVAIWEANGKTATDIAGFLELEAAKLRSYASMGATTAPV